MTKGFTLVELAIVMVIIGLLISGILVAQSMKINTSKIQKFIRQIDQFDAAVSNFQTKYNGLPGDSSVFGCVNASNKCDNSVMEDSHGNSGGYSRFFDSEISNFWPNLQQSGFTVLEGNLTSTITGTFSVVQQNQNSPSMALGSKAGVIPYKDNANLPDNQVNYYAIADWSGSNSGTDLWHAPGPIAVIPVGAAQAIDAKIDNGIPGTGVVFAGSHGAGWAQNGTCIVSSKYNISVTSDVCFVAIKMLRQTGQ